jgi:hypothetical protein
MKRNIDTIRTILLCVETPGRPGLGDITPEILSWYVELLLEANYLHEPGKESNVDGETKEKIHDTIYSMKITWKGYEFLDAARNEDVWQAAMGMIASVESVSSDVLMEVLGTVAKRWIEV